VTTTSGRKTPVRGPAPARRPVVAAAVVSLAVALFFGVALLAFGGGSAGAGGGGAAAAAGYDASPKAFDLPSLTGDGHVRLADHRGRPVVVNFFASWCVYCNQELPGFVQVAKATRGQVDFIGVQSQDTGDGLAMARRFGLEEAGFTLAKDVGRAPASDLWRSFGGQGLPTTVFFDADGALGFVSGGMLTQAELTQTLAEKFHVTVKAADAAGLQAPVIPLIPMGAAELLRTHAGDGTFAVLDVRSAAAFAGGHLEGAVNIGPADRAGQLSQLSKDRSYIVYGQDGTDSGAVTEAMHAQGFKHVYELEGGLAAWTREGGPTVR
jgi:cytochrome c biogenesis protein CcmG/thiol:disulfide interchange protein DsbE